jgi:hypothetical protein
MAKNKTHRNKSEGGKRRNKSEGGKRRNKSEGGKRKTRKSSEWTRKVTELYRKMKKEDKDATFMGALKRASELKKKGQL